MNDESFPEVTPRQAARALGVTTRTIFNYIKAGKLIARKEGKRVFIPIAEIEKFRQEYFSEKEKISQKLPEMPRQNQEISMPLQETFVTGAINFHFDPLRHIIVERSHYEGLLTRLGQYESEMKLLKDDRPWWKKIFSRKK